MFQSTCQRLRFAALRLRAVLTRDTIVRTELGLITEQQTARSTLRNTDAPKQMSLTPLNPTSPDDNSWQPALLSFAPAPESASRTGVVRAGRVSLRPIRECGVDTPASELRRD